MSTEIFMQMIQKNPRLNRAMKHLQLDKDTLHLLPIFPLIYVAWADGKFQDAAVERILEIAEENGLTEGRGAGILSVWLHNETRPSDDFFIDGMRLTAAILKYTKPNFKNNIIYLSESVAEAVGGWSGVKRTEMSALTQIAGLLKVEGAESYDTLIDTMKKELGAEDLDFLPTHVQPSWVAINAVVSAGIAAVIFYFLWKLYPTLVVTEQHENYFLFALLLLPQVGFFVTHMLTARLSPGDTRRESTYGVGLALLLALVAGGFLSGQVSKKYVGYNVARPENNAMLFPACKNAKNNAQRCIRLETHAGNTVCRLMPNRIMPPSKLSIGQKDKDWFALSNCKEDKSMGVLLYRVSTQTRVASAGYYPLCRDLVSGEKRSCIVIQEHTELKGKPKACRILSSPTAKPGDKWGSKFESWYPLGRYCAPLYARVYALWSKKDRQMSFFGYRPLCKDLHADQACIYHHIMTRPDTKTKEKVCLLSSSNTIPAFNVTLAKVPYVNWFPRAECKEVESTQPITYFMAALGFAFFALFSAYFGAWIGVLWQGQK